VWEEAASIGLASSQGGGYVERTRRLSIEEAALIVLVLYMCQLFYCNCTGALNIANCNRLIHFETRCIL
jgi:hypothetical protein